MTEVRRVTKTETRVNVPLDEVREVLRAAGVEIADDATFWVDRRNDALVIRTRIEETSDETLARERRERSCSS